jgi:hypothetical protein
MITMSQSAALERNNPGATWIHRFLVPQLNQGFPKATSLDCLQLWADDQTEAEELERLGHRCTMRTDLECESESFDFTFTGRFSARAKDQASRIQLAGEMHRILKPGGAALLVMKNRLCPIDLSRNGPGSGITLREARAVFAQFNSVRVLSPMGHFAWKRAPRPIRPLGRVLEGFWKIAEVRPSLFNSVFNPTLILWLAR